MSRYARVLGVAEAREEAAAREAAAGAKPAVEINDTPTNAGGGNERLDPRPDLEEDSAAWETLLRLAWRQDRGLGDTLHGFRCCGTRLKRVQGKWVLRPDVDPTGDAAWTSVEEYAEAREKFLRPRQKEVTELLDWLGKVVRR